MCRKFRGGEITHTPPPPSLTHIPTKSVWLREKHTNDNRTSKSPYKNSFKKFWLIVNSQKPLFCYVLTYSEMNITVKESFL